MTAFVLAPGARNAGPGAKYSGTPAGFAATAVSVTCGYNATGEVVDEGSPAGPDRGTYTWGEPFSIAPGGAPVHFTHEYTITEEVRLRAVLVFSLDGAGRLYASGRLDLFDGTSGNKRLGDEETFGPLTVERATAVDLLEVTLQTPGRASATFKLGVANEGD